VLSNRVLAVGNAREDAGFEHFLNRLLATRNHPPPPAFYRQGQAKGQRVKETGEGVKGGRLRARPAVRGEGVSRESVFGAECVNDAGIVNEQLNRRKNVARRRVRIRAVETGREGLATRPADQRHLNLIPVDGENSRRTASRAGDLRLFQVHRLAFKSDRVFSSTESISRIESGSP